MKKIMLTLIAMLTIAASANAMSYEQAREEALFLTDKMAYELNLSDAQYEAAYEINLDYLMGVTSQYDVFGPYWERRNLDLSYILFSWQWDLFRSAAYFYRPLVWNAGYWHFSIYARYPHRDYFYFGRPHFYVSYRGGHSWRMNNGRSFYESRRDFYRPAHVHRDTHFGMRNGWDRGDYRGNGGGRHSSTHVTVGNNGGRGNDRGGYRIGGGTDNRGFGSNRGGSYNNNDRSVYTPNNGNDNVNNNVGNHNNNREGFGGSRTNGGYRQGGNIGGNNGGGSYNGGGTRSGGGNFGGSRSGSTTRSNGSIGGSSNAGGGSRGGGNIGGGSRSGGSNSHGNFGGGRR